VAKWIIPWPWYLMKTCMTTRWDRVKTVLALARRIFTVQTTLHILMSLIILSLTLRNAQLVSKDPVHYNIIRHLFRKPIVQDRLLTHSKWINIYIQLIVTSMIHKILWKKAFCTKKLINLTINPQLSLFLMKTARNYLQETPKNNRKLFFLLQWNLHQDNKS
jgi:hypothetical protein